MKTLTLNKFNSHSKSPLSTYFPAISALMLAAVSPGLLGQTNDGIEFDVAEVFFELNNTDGDLGLHALMDGEGWNKLSIRNNKGRKLLDIRVKDSLRRQGLTELFFESAEPTFDKLPPEIFFKRFKEGEYTVEGMSLDHVKMASTTELTHLMPAPPQAKVNDEDIAVQCDEDEAEFDIAEVSTPVTIAWDPVIMSHDSLGSPLSSTDIEILTYEVVVETEVENEEGEELELIHSVLLPPDVTSIVVPDEFIQLGEEFKYEVLVRESSYNQTAMESCFMVEGGEEEEDDDDEDEDE